MAIDVLYEASASEGGRVGALPPRAPPPPPAPHGGFGEDSCVLRRTSSSGVYVLREAGFTQFLFMARSSLQCSLVRLAKK